MKRNIKLLISTLIFLTIFVGCGKFFQYILLDDTASYTRITFHEMYNQDNIDTLFVGSSHCYRSFIPDILDDQLGVNTFNLGTSAQKLDGSFMVIKEAARYHNIKHVYLEIYYAMAFNTTKNSNQMTETYIISDYLKPSIDKLQYLISASTKEHYFNSFIPARRNWNKFFDADYVKNLIVKKQSDDYKNFKYTYVSSDNEFYSGKGYVANKEMLENWSFFSDSGWNRIDINNISGDWLNILDNIIDFCDEKGIKLTLVSAPMPSFRLVASENYDDYIDFIQEIIADKNIDYYDFNLCREAYFPDSPSLFCDISHLNCYGAELFSRLFADLVNGSISEKELFWNSYQEKTEHMKPTILGISYQEDYDGKTAIRTCKIVSTANNDLEYMIAVTPLDEETQILQEFSENRFFSVPINDKHGIFTITYRKKNQSETLSVDIPYE